jgi:hypothetical protein
VVVVVVVVIEWDKCLVQCIPIGLDGRSVDAMTRRSVPTRQLACIVVTVARFGLRNPGTAYDDYFYFYFLLVGGGARSLVVIRCSFEVPQAAATNHDPCPTERRDAELECSKNSSQQKRSSEILYHTYRQSESRTEKWF